MEIASPAPATATATATARPAARQTALWLVCLLTAFAPLSAGAHEAALANMTAAARAALESLDEAQLEKARFPLDSEERFDWHFVPKARKGLPLGDLNEEQRDAVMALLMATLSEAGFSKTIDIIALEDVLAVLENNPERRNPDLYHLCVFGDPEADGTWAWSFEGHHLSMNFTIVGGRLLAGTPSFFGANPGEVRDGPRAGLRVLGDEEDKARELAATLAADDDRRATAFLDQTPRDILTFNQVEFEPLPREGIGWNDLTEAEQQQLWQLIRLYIGRHRAEFEKHELERIEEAGREHIVFAWAGGLEAGQGHYYRIQGPTFLVEYANVQNDAHHPHTVWRDPQNDFGRDLLREHWHEHHDEEAAEAVEAAGR